MNNKDKTKRLTNDPVKTANSYQDKLTKKEIKEKLEEYKRVEDMSKVALDAHLRYFTIDTKTGEQKFRLGGFLKKIDSEKGYVVLSSGQITWSVQLKNSIFFQKMTFQELKNEIIQDAEKKYLDEIKKLKEENKNFQKALKEIKNQIKKNKKSNDKK